MTDRRFFFELIIRNGVARSNFLGRVDWSCIGIYCDKQIAVSPTIIGGVRIVDKATKRIYRRLGRVPAKPDETQHYRAQLHLMF